jgi:outer membrane protein assembly factor BamB
MPVNAIEELHDALGLGLGSVTRIWDYKAKDWVTSVAVADIDNDGEFEVIACSRDGRVQLLNAKTGECRWQRIIGTKAWVGTVVTGDFLAIGSNEEARIILGTRDGKVYILNKDGMTLTRQGKLLPFDSDGKALDSEAEKAGYWVDTGSTIRQIYVNPEEPTDILIGSEDRCVYALDYTTGVLHWKFQTGGWVRTVFSHDINGDGETEILVGSLDKNLYIFNQQGRLLAKHTMNYPLHNLFAADVDQDGRVEILVGTDGKDLIALSFDAASSFKEKWRARFDNRLLCLCVTDIDNDGDYEIIAGSEDKHFYILDGHGDVIWRHNHKYRVFSIFPFDIDYDGIPELLLGSDNDRVRAMRIRLRKGLLKKIHQYQRLLREPVPASISALSIDERDLLQDLLKGEKKDYVSLQQAKDLLNVEQYSRALSLLLKLGQQKAQQLWHKGLTGHIRTICFRHISGGSKREVIVGTSEGDVRAYNAKGKLRWSTYLDDHIVDVQTGFIAHQQQEEIVICSSDHHIYILSGTRKREQRTIDIDTWMSSICVTAPNRYSDAEIIIGSEEKKLYIYGSDLQTPVATIDTDEGIRVVRTSASNEEQMPEIVAASLNQSVYAYTRGRKYLWTYQTHDHIRSICIKDINGDGKVEVLVGSEDRNIHVLDSTGHLLWRYYLPHSALSVDAVDADYDGKIEIFVGCADGYLYVFNREGEFLWKYQAHDRIHAVRVEDIDDDGNVEIALGSEDELELLQVVDQRQVRTLIDQCWTALCQKQPIRQVITALLNDPDPFLQAFGLSKLAEQEDISWRDFEIFDAFLKDRSVEMRKALVRAVIKCYQAYPVQASYHLQHLAADTDPGVRNTVIDYIPALTKHSWEVGFQLLEHFSKNPDRFVRRMGVRKIHHLIETTVGKKREIFDLLLTAAMDKESEWIQQEAARTLAYFLDRNQGDLIIYVHLFIVKDIQPSILRHIAHAATTLVVKYYLNAVIDMLTDLNDEKALERTQQVVNALEEVSNLLYGRDIHRIYAELCQLLVIQEIEDFAEYQYSLNINQFDPKNEFAPIVLEVFGRLNTISRMLKTYLRREAAHDRLTILLEANVAIEKTSKFLEKQYAQTLLGEPLTKLPDHYVFVLILQRWREIVQAELSVLRGKAELEAELLARYTRHDDQVGIWLAVRNKGSSAAITVKITLLHNDHFDVMGKQFVEAEIILPQEETIAEFILRPHTTLVDLMFEITYDDAEEVMKMEKFGDRLELQESHEEFRYIPNPYSTGTPTHDSKMFYGREDAMAFLQDHLTRDAKTVIVLYGQRRSGKTTLLLQLINTFASDKHIPVLIDLQRLSYHMTIQSFLYKMAYYIAQAMKKKNILVCQPEEASFEKDPTHAFDIFLDCVEEHLDGGKLILMIDEFEILEEQVVKGHLRPEVFEYLRDVVQHRQNINFLFSGTHKIAEFTKWYRSTFFNIARHYRLSKLNPGGAEDLIQQPVADFLEYEPLTVRKIHQLTADQPYLIHLMCRSIVDYCNDRCKTYVTINDVNTVLREVMQTGQFHFDWLWDQVTPEERIALAALAEGGREEGRSLTLGDIEEVYRRNRVQFKREYLITSLKTLIEADIVERVSSDGQDSSFDDSKFKIPVGLTRRWVLKEHPLEQVRKEMSD